MNITLCTYASPQLLDGPTTWLQRLLPLLRERGIESRVLFIRRASGECPIITNLRQQGFACADVLHLGDTAGRVRWILHDLATHRPDIFIPNMVIPAYFAGRWAREAGIPTVAVLHSDSDYYRAIQQQFIHGNPAYRVSGMVAVSQALEQEVDQSAAITVSRIPCGVPLPHTAAPAPGETLRLVYLGRLEKEQKRILETTQALCQAVRQVPGTEAVIYGDGSARPEVEHILQQAGDLSVRYGGRVPAEQVLETLQQGHAFVLLSDYEGIPVALMESMACGLVPICLDIRSGIPELVQHDQTGLLVPDREAAFVAAVRRLRQEPGLWPRLAAAARRKITAGYTLTAAADAWVDFLHQLVAVAPPQRPVTLPRRLTLPPPHPALARLDQRRPALPRRLAHQAHRYARQVKNILTPA